MLLPSINKAFTYLSVKSSSKLKIKCANVILLKKKKKKTAIALYIFHNKKLLQKFSVSLIKDCYFCKASPDCY